jgi:hypothetical protein
MYIKFLKKQEQANPKKKKEIIKIRAEINELEIKRTIQEIEEEKMFVLRKNKQNHQT